VRRDISKAEVERLFVGSVDGSLADSDAVRLNVELDSDAALKEKFQKYDRAVSLLKNLPREKAPVAMASLIVRRTRKRRFQNRSRQVMDAWNVPAEVVIPLMVAVLVAAFLVFTQA
jgi:anti-sigma factor RsiW